VVAAAAVAVALGSAAVVAAVRDDEQVSFRRDVQPIFDRKCVSCHPVSYPYLDLRAGRSYRELLRVPAATAPAFARVLPGRPELSYLLTHPADPSLRDLLTADERRLFEGWIRQGARPE
jgi:hypothetical protein